MRALIVLAHPLRHGLTARLAAHLAQEAARLGWELRLRDLCAEGFDPLLSASERESYYKGFRSDLQAEREELAAARVLILVFPTWWFGFPAVLKGWFDRVWAPGLAYDHAPGHGQMIPRLTGLQEVLAVTPMGAPGWVDWLVMRRPLRRVLAWGIVKPCAPRARVTWMPLYRAEAVGAPRLAAFEERLTARLRAMARRMG